MSKSKKKSKFWSFGSSKSVFGDSFGDDLSSPYGGSFSTGSSTGWEKSLYGGFERPVQDYPTISLSTDIEIIPGVLESKWHSEWFREKVVKIFLSKAKNHKLTDHLWLNAEITTAETGFFVKNKVVVYRASKDQIRDVLNEVIRKESELAELFKHYTPVIEDSEIRVTIPESECKGSGKAKPSSESPEKEDGEKEKTESEGSGDDDGDIPPPEISEGEMDSLIEKYAKGGKIAPSKAAVLKSKIAPLLEKIYKGIPLNPSEQSTVKVYMDKVAKHHMNTLKEIEGSSSKISTYSKKPIARIEKENNVETTYEQEEIAASESLVKLLDISFESKSDDIKNLRLGKMDLSKIAEVPAGNFHIYHQEVEDQDTRPFSVVILGDESGSMGCNGRITSQYSMMKILFRAFSAIMPQDKLWVYGHSGSSSPELFVYHEPDTPNFLTTIDNMLRHSMQQNYDGPIVEFIHQRVRSKTSDRIIFIVLSDGTPGGYDYGSSDDHANYKQIMEKCKRDDFIVCGIMIQIDNGRHLYNYSTRVDKMSDMPKKVSNLLNKVVKAEFQ